MADEQALKLLGHGGQQSQNDADSRWLWLTVTTKKMRHSTCVDTDPERGPMEESKG